MLLLAVIVADVEFWMVGGRRRMVWLYMTGNQGAAISPAHDIIR
jgi:hypothetical protein